MARDKFSLGDLIRAEDVSTVDRGAEQIEYIPIDKIDPDPENFYSLERIDELADSIEMIGLQQPLRVRDSDTPGRVIIVSGHRRKAACLLLRGGGDKRFERLPCIRDRGAEREELRELRLIYANSATRVLSAAEISKQIERTNAILCALAQSGYEFSGRMRDQVAAVVNTSSSRVARLSAVRKHLTPELLAEFDAGRLGETAAYRISQEEPEVQERLARKLGPAVRGITAETLEVCIEQERKTEDPSQSPPQAAATAPPKGGAKETVYAGWDVDAYLENRKREDAEYFEMLKAEFSAIVRPLSGVASRRDGIEQLKTKHGGSHHGWSTEFGFANASPKGLELEDYDSGVNITRTWTDVYDMLCVIAINGTPTAELCEAAPNWCDGTPEREGRYLCRLDLGLNKPTEQTCNYEGGRWTAYGRPVSGVGEVVGWWQLPGEGVI